MTIMHYRLYLAGFKFGTGEFNAEKKYNILIKNHNHNKKPTVSCNFKKYIFGQRTIYYSSAHNMVRVFSCQNNPVEIFCAFPKKGNSNGRKNVIEIFSRSINESTFIFCAYYWLYTFYPKFIAVPGKLINHKNKNVIEYFDCGCKIVLFDREGHYFFHQFGSSETIPISELGGFSGFGTDKIFEILMATGSRPFWSEIKMKKWLKFINGLINRIPQPLPFISFR